jgi:hypothetical protein
MSQHPPYEYDENDEAFSTRSLLKQLGLARLLVAGMFLIASDLLLPVPV